MARTDPLARARDAGRRASGDVSVEQAQLWHYETLNREIGRDLAIAQVQAREGNGSGKAGILVLALLCFLITLGALLWRDGRFEGLISKVSASISRQKAAIPDLGSPDAPLPANVEEAGSAYLDALEADAEARRAEAEAWARGETVEAQ